MKTHFFILTILILTILTKSCSHVEKPDHYQILKESTKSNQVFKIDFVNTTKGDTVKSINLFADNPYNKYGGNKIKGLKLNDIIPAEKRSHYLPERKRIGNVELDGARTSSYIKETEEKGVMIVYNIYLYGKHTLLGALSTVEVYNLLGKRIFILKDQNTNVISPAISWEYNRLCVCFEADDENGDLFNPGFRIFDLNNGQLLEEKIFSSDSYNTNASLNEELLVISCKKDYRKTDYYVYDFDLNKKYYREFSFEERCKFLRVTKQGFVFKDDNNMETIEPFKNK